jgi:hypothetical protein
MKEEIRTPTPEEMTPEQFLEEICKYELHNGGSIVYKKQIVEYKNLCLREAIEEIIADFEGEIESGQNNPNVSLSDLIAYDKLIEILKERIK